MNSTSAIAYLNTLSAQHTPCVFIIDFSKEQNHIWEIESIPHDVYISFPTFSTKNNTVNAAVKTITYKKLPIDFEQYKKSFYKVQDHLQRGNSFLVNLTAESEIETDASLLEIYRASNAPYKLLYKNSFVVFSPETFVTIQNNTIKTFPMKGTINADIPNAEHVILNNKKEQAEHATIVDLLRNDISLIANNVFVEKYRYTQQITSSTNRLIQVSSCIEGSVLPEIRNNLGELLFRLLPAGSISGAPKQKTISIIHEVETHTRGYYTGVMGYYDGYNLESAVMIRYIEQRGNNKYYKSGGGITSQSNIDEEYNELIEKIYVPTY